MPGDHGGLCKMHWEQQGEESYRRRMEEYRVPGKNDHEINILTGRVKPKQGENDVLQRNSVQKNGERFCKQQEEASDG
jgi:hypothetical protein